MSLEARNVTFCISGQTLLKHVDMVFPAGKLTALCGANGAGKTILLNILAGWLQPSQGEVLINQVNLQQMDYKSLAQQRAVLTQQDQLNIAFTTAEVINMAALPFSKQPVEDLVDDLLIQFDLVDLKERVYISLSGGERKRARIVRAILQILLCKTSAPYLLLDEPLNELDIRYRHRLMRYLCFLTESGVGVIAVLHNLNAIRRYSDEVCLLKEGQLLAHGETEATLTEECINQGFDVEVASFTTPIAPFFIVK